MITEAVIVNLYGDTAPVIRPAPNWREEYRLYCEGYDKAEDKLAYNANYLRSGHEQTQQKLA